MGRPKTPQTRCRLSLTRFYDDLRSRRSRPSPLRPGPSRAREAGSGTVGGGSINPVFVKTVCPMSPGVLQPLAVPVPTSQPYAMMNEPMAAPLSPIVIGLPATRLGESANAYRVKKLGAANPISTSAADPFPKFSEPAAPQH